MTAGLLRALSALLLGALPYASAHAQSPSWLLMSRHGECAEVARALRHKFQDLPAIAGPDEFAAEMKRRGFAVKVTHAYGGNRDAVLIEVPDREVSLIFVRRDLCKETVHAR